MADSLPGWVEKTDQSCYRTIKDGKAFWTSSRKDTLIIMANYYYYGLPGKIEVCLNLALEEYNNNGNAWHINYKGKLITVLFCLMLRKRDDSVAAALSFQGDKIGPGFFGNRVRVGLPVEPTAYGGGSPQEIILNKVAIDACIGRFAGIKDSSLLSEEDFFTGVFVHEIGHNLGGMHGDGRTMLRTAEWTTGKDSRIKGSGSTPILSSKSVVDSIFIDTLVQRINLAYFSRFEQDTAYINDKAKFDEQMELYKAGKAREAPPAIDRKKYGTNGKIRWTSDTSRDQLIP